MRTSHHVKHNNKHLSSHNRTLLSYKVVQNQALLLTSLVYENKMQSVQRLHSTNSDQWLDLASMKFNSMTHTSPVAMLSIWLKANENSDEENDKH